MEDKNIYDILLVFYILLIGVLITVVGIKVVSDGQEKRDLYQTYLYNNIR